ncbi:hypothetical protein BHE97_01900 [Aeromicrobium sp. PE09-221]|uniref:hypothetical protein n=1 Tax=Aeromicrobium sp. PE09-221 TaxID=1898043 RepID=UPI000B3EAFF6|nr:hypothetical protein [Aeromicrobium sp. PE09-221]OUZ12484.1 hypothetical protein BHE97_01900 [Aeromicrobium sp. PE09-221]
MIVRWGMAVIVGMIGAAAMGGAAAAFAESTAKLVTFLVFAACTAPVATALGWLLCVAPVTVREDEHSEDNVETSWWDQAAAAAFRDVLIVLGLVLAVVAITGSGEDLPTSAALAAVLVAAMADVGLRYAVAARFDS